MQLSFRKMHMRIFMQAMKIFETLINFISHFQNKAFRSLLLAFMVIQITTLHESIFILFWCDLKTSAVFLLKNILYCLILNFGDHYQELFRVRSVWYFEKFGLASLDLFSKISQFDWKWDVWKFFFGLAHGFPTIEHREKIFCFGEFQTNSMLL